MKKLTRFKGKAMACLVLMCLFVAQSCRKNNLMPNSNDLRNGISIAEAKAYYEKNLQRPSSSGKLMSTSAQKKEISIESILADKQPIWASAFEKELSTGIGIKVPIDFGNAYAVVNSKTQAVVPLSSLNYLFIYKDSLQTIHAEWVILEPDSSWLYGNRSLYLGKIFVKDWNGKPIKNLWYNQNGIVNPISGLKKNQLSSVGKLQTTDQEDLNGAAMRPRYCIRISKTCPKQLPCTDTYCDMCLKYCAKEFCTWTPTCTGPECQLPPPGGGGGGGGGSNPSGPHGGGGGGGYPPDDCDRGSKFPKTPVDNQNAGDNNIVPLPPCIPRPVTLKSSNIEIFMGITDPDKQDFLLVHDGIYEAFENYLVLNGDSPENKEFIDWAAGYLNENRNLSPSITRLENIYQLVKLQNYRPKDREPASYYWRPKLQDGTWDNYLTESTPLYFYPNGQRIVNLTAYNCHYYAFGLENATKVDDEHPKWVIDLSLKGWEEVTGDVKVGDRIVYYQDYNGKKDWTHSGIVTEVDADGYATKISSKMGTYQIIEHHPRDIPESYGSNQPTFLLGEKRIVAPSRIYFRKK